MLSEKMCRSICEHPKLLQGGSEALQRDGRKKHGWSKNCRGRLQGRRMSGGWWPKGRNHHHHPRHLQKPALSLRPVNVKGRRVRGMQAPKNTNQFLMHEKYEMLHMRCDSVGSDSGCSSDSDTELTDMDSYLGVLENARGALLDSPNPYGSTSPSGQFLVLHEDPLCVHEGSLLLHESSPRLQEESMQYFPSEDDLMQSQNFMQRDFVEFYDILTP